MEYYFGYFIVGLFQLYIIYLLYNDEFDKRFKTIWPILPATAFVLFILTVFPNINMILNAIVSLFIWFIFIRLVYVGPTKKLLFRYIIMYFICACSEFFVSGIFIIFTKKITFKLDFIPWLTGLFITYMLAILFARFAKKIFTKRDISYDGKAKPLVYVESLLMIGIFFATVATTQYLDEKSLIYSSITMLVVAGMTVTMLVSSDILSRREREHSDYLLLLAKNDIQMKYYTRIEEIDRQQTIYRHDMKHHLSAIAGLAEEGKSEEILKLIEQMGADIKAITPKVYTSNGLLNALLGEKESSAHKQGVKIEFTIEPSVNVEFIKETDMISMFGNLIDNAIRAEKEWDGEKLMKVKLFETDGNFLMFSVENHFVGDRSKENGKYVTTKTHKEKHGLGIESVENMAHKYGGILTLNEGKNIFMADLLLARPVKA